MNFTLDDDASQIIYSAGWAIQGTHSADLDQYFERTFHVAEQDGASVNITFSGSAIAIYGSTGPGHADYTVQFDDDVLPSQSAYASTTQFQQLLFQRDFSSSNAAGTHFVSLKAVFTDQGNWLDLDFLTFTDGNITSGASTTAAVATVTPPYLSNAMSISSSSSQTTISISSNASSSKSPSVSTVLAGLFGGILGVALIAIGVWVLLRHLYYRRRAREHAFRLGAPPPNTPKSSAFSEAITGRRPRAGTASGMNYQHGGDSVASFSLHNPFGTGSRDPSMSQVNLEMSGASLASMHAAGLGHSTAGGGSGSGSGGSGSVFADPRGYTAIPSRTPPPTLPLMAPDAPLVPVRAGTPVGGGGERKTGAPVKGPGVREFLTGSPVLWAGAKHKGDADSLRTDFLQV